MRVESLQLDFGNKVVLMYHDVYLDNHHESGFNSAGANYYKIPIDLFNNHLQVISKLIDDKVLDRDEVVFTFDDGGVSSYTYIAPLLERYGFLGHFFIVTDTIGQSNFMSEEQIRDLANRNHVIGSHSSSHPSNILNLSNEERRIEWKNSISLLESVTGRKVVELSIPNGFFAVEDIEMLKEFGVQRIYTSKLSEMMCFEDITVVGRFAINKNSTSKQVYRALMCKFYIYWIRFEQEVIHLVKIILGNNYIKFKKLIREWI